MQELQRPRIDLRTCPTIKCEKCGSIYFREVTYLKSVSAFLTGSPEDTTVPLPIYKCDECGHVNSGFNPFEEQKVIVDGE
jgi:uncharacterized Zn finger protein